MACCDLYPGFSWQYKVLALCTVPESYEFWDLAAPARLFGIRRKVPAGTWGRFRCGRNPDLWGLLEWRSRLGRCSNSGGVYPGWIRIAMLQSETMMPLSGATFPASSTLKTLASASMPSWRSMLSHSRLFIDASNQNRYAFFSNSPGPHSSVRF